MINTNIYSCRDYWYLRQVDDRIIPPREWAHKYKPGVFEIQELKRSKDDLIRPIACAYHPGRRHHYLVDVLNKTEILAYQILNPRISGIEEIIHIPNSEIVSLCVFNNDLFALDIYESRILMLKIGTEPLEKAEQQSFKIKGIKSLSDSIKIIAWDLNEKGRRVLHMMIWDSRDEGIWTAEEINGVFNFSRTTLGVKMDSINKLRISHACVDAPSGMLYFSSISGGDIFAKQYTSSNGAKLIVGKRNSSRKHADISQTERLISPRGMVVFRFNPAELRTRIKLLYKEKYCLVEDNSFLVIVDSAADLAFTVNPNITSSPILPLIGKKSVTYSPSNLLSPKPISVEEVFQGPDGILLFGEFLSSNWYILNANIGIEMKDIPYTKRTKKRT